MWSGGVKWRQLRTLEITIQNLHKLGQIFEVSMSIQRNVKIPLVSVSEAVLECWVLVTELPRCVRSWRGRIPPTFSARSGRANYSRKWIHYFSLPDGEMGQKSCIHILHCSQFTNLPIKYFSYFRYQISTIKIFPSHKTAKISENDSSESDMKESEAMWTET